MWSVLLLLHVSPASAQSPDPEAPAEEPEGSIWDYIESAEGAPPAASVVQESEELAAERLAELGFTGSVGAEPPVEYYLDPLGTTAKDPLHLDRIDPSEFDIPIVVNDDVKRWMTYFLTRGRKYYGRYLQRSTRWLPMMHRELEARGMPRDLVFLSMIESGFSTGATSYAAAAGLWQFMPATGRQYGLRVDWWNDDRRDPEKSTVAALQYLAYLHRMFAGDWWLAWASYNGGEGRVMRATQRLGTTDFWRITQSSQLHTETENYVPKLIAAAIIGKHPERYGFLDIPYEPEFAFDAVEVPGSTSVEVLARCAGITEEAFLDLNPSVRRWALSPEPETHRIRVPAGRKDSFAEAFAKVPPAERIQFVQHTVRRGESLGSIARKYGVSVDDVVRLNRIRNKNRISVGTVLVLPGGDPREVGTVATNVAPPPAEKSVPPEKSTYKVKSGETLGGIAEKHGTTVEKLQSLNGIKGTHIEAGQTLVISTTAPQPKPAAVKSSTYTVRRGDTLGSIAERYDVSVGQLKSWNKLKGTTIYPGQKLRIRE